MRLLFGFDAEKCTACGACAIACMDQNDIDVEAGQRPYRRVLIQETRRGGAISPWPVCIAPTPPVSPPVR